MRISADDSHEATGTFEPTGGSGGTGRPCAVALTTSSMHAIAVTKPRAIVTHEAYHRQRPWQHDQQELATAKPVALGWSRSREEETS